MNLEEIRRELSKTSRYMPSSGYILITDELPGSVQSAVNLLIKEGWKPLGGVAASMCDQRMNHSGMEYAQAMWKETK